MTEPRPVVPAFWIWIALTLLVITGGPILSHHRASHQDANLIGDRR